MLLDTNFFISLRRREPEAINFLKYLSPEQMVTSAIVQVEYATGEFAIDPRQEKSIHQLFAQFKILPFEENAALKTVREATKLSLPKKPNPHKRLFDLMIASTAWTHNLTILTENLKDFEDLGWARAANWREYGR
ncbi:MULTISPECIES: type II toxin-antitoxin system VapC family toxin [unclassified Meiothermus]|uniref:type II toxin-antitoxin system VapC family toxin n=1 Tax=Meiothermus sp. Pnk-1 TaxID=873128 RepID=UPI002102669A|nr:MULTISPECIES: type II toxin-antitoxin system VapC family toxin [unclassified Meiothermus]